MELNPTEHVAQKHRTTCVSDLLNNDDSSGRSESASDSNCRAILRESSSESLTEDDVQELEIGELRSTSSSGYGSIVDFEL